MSLVSRISLVEQLEQNPLDLSVGTSLSVKSLRGDGVDLVDEDDGRRVLLGQAEHVPKNIQTLTLIVNGCSLYCS